MVSAALAHVVGDQSGSAWISVRGRRDNTQCFDYRLLSSLLRPKLLLVSPILYVSLDIDPYQHSVAGSTMTNNALCPRSSTSNSSGRLSHPTRMYSLHIPSLLPPKSRFVSPILRASLDINLYQHPAARSTTDNAPYPRSLTFDSSGRRLSHPVRMYSSHTLLLLHSKSLSVSPILCASSDIDLYQHLAMEPTTDNALCLRSSTSNSSDRPSHPPRMYPLRISS